MTDLVARVLLKADGSGLVGQSREAATAIEGVGTAAIGAGRDAKELATGTAAAGSAARGLAEDQRQVAAAMQATAVQSGRATAAALSLEAADLRSAVAADRLAIAQKRVADAATGSAEEQQRAATALTAAQAQFVASNAAVVRAQDAVARSTKGKSQADREAAAEANRHAFGARNLGQQFGDLGLSIAGGISPARAFGQQAGQIGYALSEMGGRAGRLGAILTGPLGIGLTVAAAVAAPFVEKLFEGGRAAQEQADRLAQAATAADSYGAAQTLLGKVIDTTTGKLKTQNAQLLTAIRLQAQANILAAQKGQEEAADTLRGMARRSTGETVGAAFGAIGRGFTSGDLGGGVRRDRPTQAQAQFGPLQAAVDTYARIAADPKASPAALERGYNAAIRFVEAASRAGKLGGRDRIDVLAGINQVAVKRNDQQANQFVIDALDGKGVDDRLKPYERPKKERVKKPASTEARDEFGRDAADRLAGIAAQFDDSPPALAKTNAELRKLDDLIDDLGRKKPVGFQDLVASAEAAKVTVRRGLIDGIAEAFDRPRTVADQAAVAFGQLDAIVADLEARRPPGFEGLIADAGVARAAITDGLNRPLAEFVEGQRQQFEVGRLVLSGQLAQAEAQRAIYQIERQRGPLTEEQRAAVVATTEALIAQERQIERLHRRQQILLGALGDVRSIVTQTIYEGPRSILDLPKRLTEAVRRFTAEKITEQWFGDAFDKLRDQATGADIVQDASDRMAVAVDAVSSQTNQTTAALGELARAATGAAGAVADPAGFGRTRDAAGGIDSDLLSRGGAVDLSRLPRGGETESDVTVVGQRLRMPRVDPFAGGIAGVLKELGKRVGIDDAKAERIGDFVGAKASKGLRGAVEGQAAASVAGLFGIKTSSTGAGIGGAIGGLTGLPGGSIVGGLLGGVVGGLFAKPKFGTAAVGSSGGEASLGVSGNGAAAKGAAGTLGEAVQSGVARIAEQLGGTLGDFAVSIGTYKDKVRVSTTGFTGRLGNQGKNNDRLGIVDFGKDGEAAAVAFAIRDAIADGAVQGLSERIQRALASSTDIDKALAEALKVQELETLLGGITGQIGAAFKQLDKTAAERVRLARQYGFDLLQVEKVNADERAKLLEQTLRDRVGSLKDLLKDLSYGDLFEGTASERRSALKAELETARADQAAGKEGAGDRIADIVRQLIATSEEAFGTAGPELAADRALGKEAAERAIQVENDRIAAAAAGQAAQTDAIRAGNDLLDEANGQRTATNGLLADMLEELRRSNVAGLAPNLALVTR